eukprot:3067000-Rhodomonas_salina.3
MSILITRPQSPSMLSVTTLFVLFPYSLHRARSHRLRILTAIGVSTRRLAQIARSWLSSPGR